MLSTIILGWLSAVTCALALSETDSIRDVDPAQSSYAGGNHNLDPAVIDSPAFGQLWKVDFDPIERVRCIPICIADLTRL